MYRKKVLAVSGILLAFAGIIFTLVVVRQKTDNFTHAAAPDQLEAEGGVLGGNAQVKQDTNASGGNYVALGVNATPTIASNAFFVATNGNDSNNGSQTNPWKTLQKAVNAAPDGATIYLRAGSYAGADITRSNITLTSYPGETATLTAVNSDGTLRMNILGIKGKWLDASTHIPSENITVSNLIFDGCYDFSLCTEGSSTNLFGADILTDKANNITIKNNTLKNQKSYGTRIYQSTNVIVDGNDILGNETGIEVHQNGTGVIIQNNKIHDNNKLIIKTPKSVNPNDDVGAEGLSMYYADGLVTVKNNQFYNNRAPSDDFIEDGGAMDIFGGQGPYTITGNISYSQDTFLETGQHPNSDPSAVDNTANISFSRNVGWNLRTYVIARAAKNSIFSNNTFYADGNYKFLTGQVASGQYGWVIHQETNTSFGGYIDGIKVTNNITETSGNEQVYSISNLPSNAVIDSNLIYNASGGVLADNGNTTINQLRSAYGIETNGIQADPLFVDPAINDFHLKPGSPASGKGAY